jgi:hypothetical protein
VPILTVSVYAIRVVRRSDGLLGLCVLTTLQSTGKTPAQEATTLEIAKYIETRSMLEHATQHNTTQERERESLVWLCHLNAVAFQCI